MTDITNPNDVPRLRVATAWHLTRNDTGQPVTQAARPAKHEPRREHPGGHRARSTVTTSQPDTDDAGQTVVDAAAALIRPLPGAHALAAPHGLPGAPPSHSRHTSPSCCPLCGGHLPENAATDADVCRCGHDWGTPDAEAAETGADAAELGVDAYDADQTRWAPVQLDRTAARAARLNKAEWEALLLQLQTRSGNRCERRGPAASPAPAATSSPTPCPAAPHPPPTRPKCP